MKYDDERILLQQSRIVRYLIEHMRHGGFEPVDSDEDHTIGWRCSCREDGCDVDMPIGWYNDVGRWQKGAWGRYQAIRYARAKRWGHQAARQMWSDFAPKAPTPEELEANKKAKELLYRFLSKKQRDQLESVGYFEQVGGDGNLYRLWYGEHRSIELVEGGEVTKRLCVHPRIIVPVGDTLLAQKLLLQGDIDRVYKTANVTDTRTQR